MQSFPLSENIFRNRRVVFRFCAAGAPYMGAFPERSAPTARKRPAGATSRREAHAAQAGVVFLLSLLSREGGAFFSVGARSILYRKPGGACTRRPFLGFPTAGACSREPLPAFSRSARRRQLAGGRLSPPQGLRHVPRRLSIAAVVRHPQAGHCRGAGPAAVVLAGARWSIQAQRRFRRRLDYSFKAGRGRPSPQATTATPNFLSQFSSAE